jgi:hypothetical protein
MIVHSQEDSTKVHAKVHVGRCVIYIEIVDLLIAHRDKLISKHFWCEDGNWFQIIDICDIGTDEEGKCEYWAED